MKMGIKEFEEKAKVVEIFEEKAKVVEMILNMDIDKEYIGLKSSGNVGKTEGIILTQKPKRLDMGSFVCKGFRLRKDGKLDRIEDTRFSPNVTYWKWGKLALTDELKKRVLLGVLDGA
jgi:hypothetical protein